MNQPERSAKGFGEEAVPFSTLSAIARRGSAYEGLWMQISPGLEKR